MKSPVFLFSLPRAGSTLLQRVLMSHPSIASVAEPWLLLPLLYASREQGVVAEYSQGTCSLAIRDFIRSLPDGELDYLAAIHDCAFGLYERMCREGEIYFLDKTPRYYEIIADIARVFPAAKFIFLFRNPVHVMASIIRTWGANRLKCLSYFHRDLCVGPAALSRGYDLLRDKAYALRYEDFVESPGRYLMEICEYLELEGDEEMLRQFRSQDTQGRMGDPTGGQEYGSVSTNSLGKWKRTLAPRFRKRLASAYVERIGEDVLASQGYDRGGILQEIRALSSTNERLIQDPLDYVLAWLVRHTKANLFVGDAAASWGRRTYLS